MQSDICVHSLLGFACCDALTGSRRHCAQYQLKSLNGLAGGKDLDLLEGKVRFEKDERTGRVRLRAVDTSTRQHFQAFVYPLDRAYDR
jgi:hypothetical protein